MATTTRTAEIVQAELDRLRAARASGASRIVVQGRDTTLRSVDDLNKAEQALLDELDSLLVPPRPRIRQLYFRSRSDKGFY